MLTRELSSSPGQSTSAGRRRVAERVVLSVVTVHILSDLYVHHNIGLPAHPTSGYEGGSEARASAVSKPISVPSIRIPLCTPEARPSRLPPLVQSAAGASIRAAVPTRTLPRLRHGGSQELCDEQEDAHALANLELPNKTCCCGTKDEPWPLREQSAARSIPWDTIRLPMMEYCLSILYQSCALPAGWRWSDTGHRRTFSRNEQRNAMELKT